MRQGRTHISCKTTRRKKKVNAIGYFKVQNKIKNLYKQFLIQGVPKKCIHILNNCTLGFIIICLFFNI